MKIEKSRARKARYIPVVIILGIFVALTAALLGQTGWIASFSSRPDTAILDQKVFQEKKKAEVPVPPEGETLECLYLWDSSDEDSSLLCRQMSQILKDMGVRYAAVDIDREEVPPCSRFEKVVLGFSNYEKNRNGVADVMEWTAQGGGLLIAAVPEVDTTFRWVSQQVGIVGLGNTRYKTPGIRLKDDFLLAGSQKDYEIENPFESSIIAVLDESCQVHMVSSDEKEIPLLWEYSLGQGQVAVVNLGIYEKSCRGIYASAYSLLGDFCAYPVINGAAFYLDGFPAPLPQGKNAYIFETYGDMDLYTFYINEWWPDLLRLAQKYDIRYTGSLVESSAGGVEPPFEVTGARNRYQYFGAQLLENGGEIGIYGYNNLPLCTEGFESALEQRPELDYQKDLKLKYWKTKNDMAAALQETSRFFGELFSEQNPQVYTPPANILSEEGRQILRNTIPEIRAVAGSYMGGDFSIAQEFAVSGDGLIETPRITYGCYINSDMKLSALSELNMHYVNTHFMYLSDVLNPDLGAELGWPELCRRLEEYMDWLYGAAPEIRRLTGSGTAAAVQRFYYVQAEKKSTETGMELELSNFQDEAWFLIRFNAWEPEESGTSGGKLTRLQGDLYLLKAENQHVTVQRKAVQ